MKKYTIIIIAIALSFASNNILAQTSLDAYRYSQQFHEGSARSVAMGNATVALGGDIGSLTINPAASGVYRYHEVVFSPSVTNANSETNYLGITTNNNKTRFGVSNFGYVGSFSTGRKSSGLINWNFAVAFNRTNNFTSRMSATGRTAESSWLSSVAQNLNNFADNGQGVYAPDMDMNTSNDPFYSSNATWKEILSWNTSLLDTLPDSPFHYIAATENLNGYDITMGGELEQRFAKESVGNLSEAVINLGGNIADKLFFGVNIGITSIWYKYSECYSETAVNHSQFDSQFSNFSHYYRYSTSGTGINLKAGVIYLPVKGLRLGASISTPTYMFLHEEWSEDMESNFTDGYSQFIGSPLGTYDYKLNTPFRWNVGAACTFGTVGVISIDYENVNYSKMKFKEDEPVTSYDSFAETNREIRDNFKSSNIVRIGAEINATQQFAIRGGYQYYSSGYKYDKTAIQIGSIGLGYNSAGGFFADIAYQMQIKNEETFTLYDDIADFNGNIIAAAPVGANKYGNWKLILSVGLRF